MTAERIHVVVGFFMYNRCSIIADEIEPTTSAAAIVNIKVQLARFSHNEVVRAINILRINTEVRLSANILQIIRITDVGYLCISRI